MGQNARRGVALTGALLLSLAVDAVAWAGISISPPPVLATNDAYSLDEDTTLTVAAPGVLENDTSTSDACVATVDTSSLAGHVSLAADGSLEFLPNANFSGATTFTYGLAAVGLEGCPGPYDGQATVTLTVSPVNDPPTAKADAFQFIWGQTLNIPGPGLLANDADVDGDALTAMRVSGPVHGVLTLAANGGFSYTPPAGSCPGKPDAFSYRASDGGATSPMRTVQLNPAALPCPTATPAPTPTIAPTATPGPTPSAAPTAEPSPTATIEPSSSVDPGVTASPEPSVARAASPAPSALPESVDQEGRLSLPVLLVLVLFVVILAFGAAYAIPRWINAQRSEPLDPE